MIDNQIIYNLWNNGFKLVPLAANGNPIESWTPIYENSWPAWDQLMDKEFVNVATCLGKSHTKDNGRALYLNVIDIDSQEALDALGGENFISIMKGKTFVTKTRKSFGYHVYWFSHEQLQSVKTSYFEIKTNKELGLCTLPPSTHRSDPTFQYQAVGQGEIMINDDLYAIVTNRLIKFIQWDSNGNVAKPTIAEIAEKKIAKGERHEKLLKISCSLLGRNRGGSLSDDDILKLAYNKNLELCEEPLSYEEFTGNVWKQALKYATSYETKPDVEVQSNVSGSGQVILTVPVYNPFNDPKAGQPEKVGYLAEHSMKTYRLKTLSDTNEILVCEFGAYKDGANPLLRKEMDRLAGNKISLNLERETLGRITARTYVKREEFDKDLHLFNFPNGVLNVLTNEFVDHPKDFLSRIQMPFDYNPSATTKLKQFLDQILYPEDVDAMLDAIAYTFVREHVTDMIVILHGAGSNGKTVLLYVIETLHGSDLVSHESIHELTADRYSKAQLEGKNINLTNETKKLTVSDANILKELTSPKPQRLHRKHIQPYDAVLHAKIWTSANHFPEFGDDSTAMVRRLNIFEFPNTFEEGKNANPNLKEELTSPEELSGIFNLLLPRIKKIIQTKQVTYAKKTIEERRAQIHLTARPVEVFVEEKLAEKSNLQRAHTISKKDMYDRFAAWCAEKKISVLSEKDFTQRMKDLGYVEVYPKVDGKTVRSWSYAMFAEKAPENAPDVNTAMNQAAENAQGGN